MEDSASLDILRRTKFGIAKVLNKIESQIQKISEGKSRILYITPHLSTGGMPQYLLKKIEIFSQVNEVFCIQMDNTAEAYNVQRNQIREILGKNFSCVEGDEELLLEKIEEIAPDIIHFEDFVEYFLAESTIKSIYSLDRPYFILETCHGSSCTIYDKRWCPDKFVMVNEFMVERFKPLGIPVEMWEYPIEKFLKPDRDQSLLKLGLDPTKKHIINVGLFTPGKNQKELIEYASSLLNENYEFHFIGNTAPNFQEYWEPLLDKLPSNCRIWGERADVDSFYKCADLFVFTSTLELNPIVVKESLSWDLPILMRRLDVYGDKYDKNPLVHYLGTREENLELIKKLLS